MLSRNYATSNFTFLAELGDYIISPGQLQLHSVFIVIIRNQIIELHQWYRNDKAIKDYTQLCRNERQGLNGK